jgi:PAS domain S-box-containing protein
MNLVIALAYFAICATILRGLAGTRQLRRNPLGLATAAIFFTCAVHHGLHTLHMLAPIVGADVAHGVAMRSAFAWQSAVWDTIGAAVAVYYLSLRRSYPTLLRTPEMFLDEVRLASAERVDHERRMLTDAEELAGAGSFEYEIATSAVRWSPGMYRIHGVEAGVALTSARAQAVDPRDRERVQRTLGAAVEGDATLVELTYRIVRPDGQVRWLETRDRIERDAGGRAVRMLGVSVDVTARRESERLREAAEAVARDRERMLRSVVDNNMALIFVKDLDGRYLLYNTRFAEALDLAPRAADEGVATGEVLLGRDDAWLNPALARAWRKNDVRSLAGSIEIEEFSEHPVRGPLTFDSIKFPLFGDDGFAYATCGVSLETTQRTLEREQLAVAARYFDLSRDLTVASSFDGYFRSVNPAVEHILGWSAEEFLARPFIDMVHPDDRDATMREVAKLAEGQITFSFLNRYEAKDGSYRWLDWNAIVAPEEELMYASARDVTDRKAVEAALEASERNTRLILETAHDAFISFDEHGVITGWNPQAQRSFGWSRDEVLGRDLVPILIPLARRGRQHRNIARFVETGAAPWVGVLFERTMLHRDGHELPVELTITPIPNDDGYSFNAFLRDITERKRTREELALVRDRALEASKLKSMFVANVSHEIRTPMNGVIGMTELLLDTPLDDEQREYAETISASGESLLAIIDDILDLSKIEAGKLELEATAFDPRDALERACGMLAADAHRKGLELVLDVDPGVPALVRGDPARLRQVIANLVSNAIKFTAAGEVVVRARSRRTEAGRQLVRVEVCDTGIGIASATLERLFEPFAQADASTTRKYGGTGLGLAISSQLVEMMGGRVGVESEPGAGSRFWFELTLESLEPAARAVDERSGLAGLRVLVVDDNATSRRLLERQLAARGMVCATAAGAEVALDELEAAASAGEPFALALLDLVMPEVDGYALAAAIRARPSLAGTRLVLLGSFGASRGDAPDQAVFDGVLTKPVRQSRLLDELRSAISGERLDPRGLRGSAAVRPPGPAADVLVVEDTPVNQTVAAIMLEKCGYAPHVARNGREALEKLSQRSYVAVLMDGQMPELDGYDTTREIRRRERGGPRMPIIAMTASSMEGERDRCLEAGMDDFLAKPLRNQALRAVLARWVPPSSPAAASQDAAALVGDAHGQLLDESTIADVESLGGGMLTTLVALYLGEVVANVDELAAAIDCHDMATVARTAHQIKGSSGTVGAACVAAIAARLEAAGDARDEPSAGALLKALRGGLDATRTALAGRVAS